MADEKKLTLTEKQAPVIAYLQNNGGSCMKSALCEALGTDVKHLTPVITGLSDTAKNGKGFIHYEKVAVEGNEKGDVSITLTDLGRDFVIAD